MQEDLRATPQPFFTRIRNYLFANRAILPPSRALLLLETRLPFADLPQYRSSDTTYLSSGFSDR